MYADINVLEDKTDYLDYAVRDGHYFCRIPRQLVILPLTQAAVLI